MQHYSRIVILFVFTFTVCPVFAASKVHMLALGRPTNVRVLVGPNEDKPVELKVRSLYVDGKLKEFTFGSAHDVTERLFVVRRIVRVNDALSEDNAPRWTWQRSGWLIVDRISAHVSQANLAEFDPEYSASGWFRDYVAYCGVSDDGKKLFAIVAQLGRHKSIFKKSLGEVPALDSGDNLCGVPTWQRQPTRVTFITKAGEKFTYDVRARSVEVVTEDDDDGD